MAPMTHDWLTLNLAMNTGTQAAKEASNMVDLDSNPGRGSWGSGTAAVRGDVFAASGGEVFRHHPAMFRQRCQRAELAQRGITHATNPAISLNRGVF